MTDTTAPAPISPIQPKPKRVRRWPTVLVTCLLTLVAAYLLERYVLPTQGWWVAHNRDRHPSDTHYLEEVVYSKALSPEAKVRLVCEAVGNPSPATYRSEHTSAEPWLAERMWEVADVIAAVLQNPHPNDDTLASALRLLQVAAKWGDPNGEPLPRLNNVRLAIWEKVGPPLQQVTTRPNLSPRVREQLVVTWACVGSVNFWDHEHNERRHCFPADFLVGCLSDPDAEIRTYAARALGFTTNENDVPNVAAALRQRLSEEPASVIPAVSQSNVRLSYAGEQFNNSYGDPDPHQIYTPSNYSRLEMVHSLGKLNYSTEAVDTTRTLLDIVRAPRPPVPPFPRKLDNGNAESKLDPNDPWVLDQFLRAEAILTLARFRGIDQNSTAQADAAVLATLNGGAADCPWTDFAVLAAAVYLGRFNHPDAGPALLAKFREVKAVCLREADRMQEGVIFRNREWTTTPNARVILLTTLAEALGQHPEVAGQAVSELTSMLPVMDFLSFTGVCLPFQTRLPTLDDWRWGGGWALRICPPPRVAWWRPVSKFLATKWSLQEVLERIGPPAKEDVPNLRALLDYDGKGITDDQKLVERVRQEAAKALLRDTTAGTPNRRAVLEKVIADPESRPPLVEEAKTQLQQLPASGK